MLLSYLIYTVYVIFPANCIICTACHIMIWGFSLWKFLAVYLQNYQIWRALYGKISMDALNWVERKDSGYILCEVQTIHKHTDGKFFEGLKFSWIGTQQHIMGTIFADTRRHISICTYKCKFKDSHITTKIGPLKNFPLQSIRELPLVPIYYYVDWYNSMWKKHCLVMWDWKHSMHLNF